MQIIGHRGARGLALENSLEAIKKAIDCKVDMIEVDIRMQGNRVVLSHDPTLKNDTYTNLNDALNLINSRIPLNIEIKESEAIIPTVEILKGYKGKIIISSKSFSILQEIRRELPKTEIAVIESWSGVRAVASASYLKTNRIHINHNWLWAGFVKSMKHRGFLLFAYTVNDTERASELKSWGIDGVFTDFPDRFNKLNNSIKEN